MEELWAARHKWKFHLLFLHHVTKELRERSEVMGIMGPDTLLKSGRNQLRALLFQLCMYVQSVLMGRRSSPFPLTCVVFGLQMHVTKLMDIADIHLFFVNLRFVKVL